MLNDSDLLKLSERITNRDELMKLGVNDLKLPDCKIKSALYDHRDSINSAAYEVLSSWQLQHENRNDAHNILLSSLTQHNMMYLIGAIQEAGGEITANLPTSTKSKKC